MTLWFAWRAVNYPTFADFLIATEAEINKVSWTSRKALIRDTIVVLTTLILLTFFLFVVDLFWNAVLSSRFIGVLPTEKDRQEAVGADRNPEPVKDW
jgi:preprotein translocase SecE subunit